MIDDKRDADPALEQIPVFVETSERTALKSAVWRELKVASRIDKFEFLRWLRRHIEPGSSTISSMGAHS